MNDKTTAAEVRDGVCTRCGSGVTQAGEHVRNDLPPCYGVSRWWDDRGSAVDSVADGGRSSVGSTPGPADASRRGPSNLDFVQRFKPSCRHGFSEADLERYFAARMTRNGYVQERCPGCGRFTIWVKPKRAAAVDGTE